MNDPGITWRQGEPLSAGWPETLPELCARIPREAVVLEEGSRCWTWGELEAGADRLAGALAGQVPAGAAVALLGGNSTAHLLLELAVWRLGALACPLWIGLGETVLADLLADLRPVVALISEGAQAALCGEGCRVLRPGELLALAARPGPGASRPVASDQACLLLHSSGSTGIPKGVRLSHGNLCSQQAAYAWLWPEVGLEDRFCAHLPWHHSYGALAERLWALARGARLVLVPGGGRDRAALAACLRRVRPTVFMSVPRLHAEVAAARLLDPACLRFTFTAGAPLPSAVEAAYAAQGLALREGWGCSETSPSACITRAGTPRQPGLVGPPIPGVAVGVADDGRVLVRGPNVMLGYRGGPPTDGTFDSGDLGEWTPHGLRLLGRADGQLKAGNGEKLQAEAVERYLAACPGLRSVQVCLGADGALVAVCEPLPGFVPAALQDLCQGLPGWQRPVRLLQAARAFATGAGKPARAALAAALQVWERQGGADFRPLEDGC